MAFPDPTPLLDPDETSSASKPAIDEHGRSEDPHLTKDFRNRFTEARWKIARACLALLLLAPLCVSRSVEKPFSLGLPGVLSGDEPHYLVMINSVIDDGDFDLANNYQNAHGGGLQAGRKFSGLALDHHVNWYQDDQIVKWWQVYEMDAERWDKDNDGHPIPTLQRGQQFRLVSDKEYSQHPVGLAVVLAPILVAFRGTSLVEPVAIFCSGLATVGGFLSWCWLVKPYTKLPSHLLVASAVAYLGSPLWHYGQDLYSESFLAFFAVAAFAAALRGEKYFIAGLLVGAGILIKAPFGLVALPLIGDALLRGRWRQAFECAFPVALAAFLVLFWNHQMYGDWLRSSQEWERGSLLEGSLGFTFSWDHGLLLVSPDLCLCAIVLPEWFQKHRRDAILLTLAVLLYGGLMASWVQWWGGQCYSARLILPIVPFLFAPIALLFDTKTWKTDRLTRILGTTLIIISLIFGAISAFKCDNVWGQHPIQLLW